MCLYKCTLLNKNLSQNVTLLLMSINNYFSTKRSSGVSYDYNKKYSIEDDHSILDLFNSSLGPVLLFCIYNGGCMSPKVARAIRAVTNKLGSSTGLYKSEKYNKEIGLIENSPIHIQKLRGCMIQSKFKLSDWSSRLI